jgi:hypothetical protein
MKMEVIMIDNNIYYKVFDEVPMAMFIVDDDVKVQYANKETKKILENENIIYHKRGGELLKCVHSTESELGCGHSHACKSCVIRNSVNNAVEGQKTYRKQAVLKMKKDGQETIFHSLITTSPFEFNHTKYYLLMIENVNELIQLKEIIPICANCKKIRNDENYWIGVEHYFHEHTDVDFSHSICPDCMDILYPELKEIRAKKKEAQKAQEAAEKSTQV